MDVQRDDDDKRMRELLGCLDAMRGMLHVVRCMPAVCCSFSMRCALPLPLLPAAVRRCNALQQTRYSISGFQVRHFDTTGRARQRNSLRTLGSAVLFVGDVQSDAHAKRSKEAVPGGGKLTSPVSGITVDSIRRICDSSDMEALCCSPDTFESAVDTSRHAHIANEAADPLIH